MIPALAPCPERASRELPLNRGTRTELTAHAQCGEKKTSPPVVNLSRYQRPRTELPLYPTADTQKAKCCFFYFFHLSLYYVFLFPSIFQHHWTLCFYPSFALGSIFSLLITSLPFVCDSPRAWIRGPPSVKPNVATPTASPEGQGF